MRETFLRHLPNHQIQKIDGIILTHGHADAVLGLDDVRDLQECTWVDVPDPNNPSVMNTGCQIKSGPLIMYLHQETMDTVSKQFGYLTGKPVYLDERNYILERRVALLDFHVINYHENFVCCGLSVRSFPVYHGGKYISLGFSFGKEGDFVYISDVKIIPDDTWIYLKSIPKIKTLVLDCLDEEGIFSHFGLNEAIEAANILQPDILYLTGMSCGFGLHDERQEYLNKLRPNTILTYDGLTLDGFHLY